MKEKQQLITNNNMDLSQRVINELLTHLKSNPSRLAKELGYSSNVKIQHIKSGRNGISTEVAADIVNKFPNINYDWLLTGKGDMIISEDKSIESNDVVIDDLPINQQLIIIKNQNEELRRELLELRQEIKVSNLITEISLSSIMVAMGIKKPIVNPESKTKPKSKSV